MEDSEFKEEQRGGGCGGARMEQREVVMSVRILQELSRSMEAIEEDKGQEDQSDTSMATEKECMCNIFSFVDRFKQKNLHKIYHLFLNTKKNAILNDRM